MSTEDTDKTPGQTRLVAFVERGLVSWALNAARRPALTLAAVALLTSGALVASTRLSLSADLMELLPDTFESVQQLDRLAQSFGGFGFVVVVAQNADPEKLIEFADDLAPQLDALQSGRSLLKSQRGPVCPGDHLDRSTQFPFQVLRRRSTAPDDERHKGQRHRW